MSKATYQFSEPVHIEVKKMFFSSERNITSNTAVVVKVDNFMWHTQVSFRLKETLLGVH